jgi:hypothetical protein
MNRNIKRHIKTILSVIGLFSLPILLYFLVYYLGLPFVLFLLIVVSMLAIGIVYRLFYDEFE